MWKSPIKHQGIKYHIETRDNSVFKVRALFCQRETTSEPEQQQQQQNLLPHVHK
jgi:hypothetical protein